MSRTEANNFLSEQYDLFLERSKNFTLSFECISNALFKCTLVVHIDPYSG
jgi:hypothetical protein